VGKENLKSLCEYIDGSLKSDFIKIFLDLFKIVEKKNENDFNNYKENYRRIMGDYINNLMIKSNDLNNLDCLEGKTYFLY